MEDFANILHRDYGLKPQGKLAPMAAGKSEGSSPVSSIGRGKNGSARTSRSSVSFAPEGDDIFFGGGTKSSVSNSYGSYNGSGMGAGTYDDVFGGPPKFTPPKQPAVPSFDSHDSIFRMPQKASSVSTKESASPIFDMPTYDDDIFGGVRGTRAPGTYDNVFGAESSSSVNDDLLGGFKQSDPKPKASSRSSWQADPDYDDLLPGFRSDLPRSGSGGDSKPSQETERSSFISVDSPPRPAEVDPFGGLASEPAMFSNTSSATYSDDLDPFNIPAPVSSKQDGLRSPANGTNDGLEGFDAFSPPPLKPSTASRKPLRPSKESAVKSNSNSQKEEIKSVRRNFSKMADSIPSRTDAETKVNSPPKEKEDFLEKQVPLTSINADRVPESMPEAERVKETWLTIDDVRLLTQPTAVPPPPRPPPGYMRDRRRYEFGSGTEVPQEDSDSGAKIYVASSIEEFEEFASGRSHADFDAGVEDSLEDEPIFGAAATMKDAIDRTQAKLKVAKEAKENGKDRAKEKDRDEREVRAAREREEREKEEREKEEREKEWQRKEREREKEREKDRAAVQRATQEARERAAQDAKEKAERAAVERATAEARERAAAEARQKAAERAAVEKAAAEARLRAERAAVERANAEARERAAAEARERANAETRERAAAADARAAVERANAEARERAAAEARERVAASRAEKAAAERAAREREAHRKADDLESIFGTRPSSAPRQRPPAPDIPETRSNKNFSSEIPRGGSGGVRKVASATNIDEWTSLFATPSSSEFQEVDGEPPERRKARWERHQQTLERAAKALAEKKQRDVDVLRQQAEKDRISESLNAEIKRWAAGKEGNLRALLSTLQYVLWPECGWQPVSLTDLITGASVKKVYRKATLCVHPDKVQQKGATVQQSYIAEKVFDLLKEAWNKFNSEELF